MNSRMTSVNRSLSNTGTNPPGKISVVRVRGCQNRSGMCLHIGSEWQYIYGRAYVCGIPSNIAVRSRFDRFLRGSILSFEA